MKTLLFTLLFAAGAIGATSPAAPILPTGTYHYDLLIGGKPVGSSTLLVRHHDGIVEIGESGSLAGATIVSNRKLTETTFATLSYVADAGGKHVVVTVAGNTATASVGTTKTPITTPSGEPFLVNDNLAAGFAQTPALLEATGAQKFTLACVCGAFIALPVQVSSFHDGSATVSFQGQSATMIFDPHTFILQRFDLPVQNFSLVLRSYDPSLTVLPSPAPPTPLPLPSPNYSSRDAVIVADDGVHLAGTLTIPNDAHGKNAAFLLVHGSGCIDRDETIGPNKVFAQLANRLSNDGYVVLRYDKRSCGKSGGTFAVRDRLIADARDAIAYLRAQPEVDPKRIFVLGHSEGGELVPSVAIADRHLRGIVLMAPPAIPLDQILMQQALRLVPASERAAMTRRERANLDAIASGKRNGPEARWLRSSFGVDPAKLIANVPCPILILQGTKDIQVLPADTPRLVAAARAAKRNVTVVMLDGDDHLFLKLAAGESSSGGEYFTPSYLDPALFDAIESWLKEF